MEPSEERAAYDKKWTLTKQGALLWRSWGDGEFLVYHTASGDTHLVNEVTAEVLRQLEPGERDFTELVESTARSLDALPDASFTSQLDSLLVYLDEVGLVEPAS